MVLPKARRGRKRVLGSSDDEQQNCSYANDTESVSTLVSRPKNTEPRPRELARPSRSPKSTPEITPTKPRSNRNKSKGAGEPIYSFFNAETQRQQLGKITPKATKLQDGDRVDDIVDGDASDPVGGATIPSSQNRHLGQRNAVKGQSTLKRSHPTDQQKSNKFLKDVEGRRASTSQDQKRDTRPWNEKYAPVDIDELVVHKKKIADVRKWLEEALSGLRHRRLLVLKGPAGSGKTTTVSLLSKALNYQIAEWTNPSSLENDSTGYMPILTQFDDFLGRGQKYHGLDIVSSEVHQSEVNYEQSKDQQILLVEDFPNVLTSSNHILNSFRSTILQYIGAEYNSLQNRMLSPPVVMIISESAVPNPMTRSLDYTAHRLLGQQILTHPNVRVLEFNAVAPTFVSRALKIVLGKHRRETGSNFTPSAESHRRLTEFGDVRNALSALEFAFQQGEPRRLSDQAPRVRSSSRSSRIKPGSSLKQNNGSDPILSLVSLRESTIGLFHAVGKVVYNKRFASGKQAQTQLPEHLSHLERQLQSEVEIDGLVDETGTDSSTFVSALHENYIKSCNSPDDNTEKALQVIGGCVDALGDADLLSNYMMSGTNQEALKQDEIAFDIAVRGVLFSLPYPVERFSSPGKDKLDAHKMLYPVGLKLRIPRDEMSDLVDLLVERYLGYTLLVDARLEKRTKLLSYPISQPGRMPQKDRKTEYNDSTNAYTNLASGQSARRVMCLDMLPFLNQILSQQSSVALLEQIDKITRMDGLNYLGDEDDFDERTNTSGGQRSNGVFQSRSPAGDKDQDLALEKLILSDDDIEDD